MGEKTTTATNFYKATHIWFRSISEGTGTDNFSDKDLSLPYVAEKTFSVVVDFFTMTVWVSQASTTKPQCDSRNKLL